MQTTLYFSYISCVCVCVCILIELGGHVKVNLIYAAIMAQTHIAWLRTKEIFIYLKKNLRTELVFASVVLCSPQTKIKIELQFFWSISI